MSIRNRQRIDSLAHLTSTRISAQPGEVPYHEQLLAKIQELFAAADPQETKLLIGIDLMSFSLRNDEQKLISSLNDLGMTYKVVRFGGKSGKDTGVLVTRQLPVTFPDSPVEAIEAPVDTTEEQSAAPTEV